jgi:DNA-binding HxlR family transcriptional regulator
MARDANAELLGEICPHYEAAFEVLGRRWTGLIITALVDGPRRFSEVGGAVDGLSDKMLSQRLTELEESGIVTRSVDTESRPVAVSYDLTAKGKALKPAFEALQMWAEEWMAIPATVR